LEGRVPLSGHHSLKISLLSTFKDEVCANSVMNVNQLRESVSELGAPTGPIPLLPAIG